MYPLLFYVRRILFAVAILYMRTVIAFQLMFYILPTLAVLMLLGWCKPMQSRFYNLLEVYNNGSVMLLAYCLLCLTDFVPGPFIRNVIGFVMVVLTFQNLFVNLYLIAIGPVMTAIMIWKKYWTRNRHKRGMADYRALRERTKLFRLMAAPSDEPLFTLHEEDEEDDGTQGRNKTTPNESQRQLLRTGQANFDSEGNPEETARNGVNRDLVDLRVSVASGRV